MTDSSLSQKQPLLVVELPVVVERTLPGAVHVPGIQMQDCESSCALLQEMSSD